MLTNVTVAKIVEAFGHGKLPSGCHFIPLNRDITEEIVVAPAKLMPKIYYFKSDESGELISFRAM